MLLSQRCSEWCAPNNAGHRGDGQLGPVPWVCHGVPLCEHIRQDQWQGRVSGWAEVRTGVGAARLTVESGVQVQG